LQDPATGAVKQLTSKDSVQTLDSTKEDSGEPTDQFDSSDAMDKEAQNTVA